MGKEYRRKVCTWTDIFRYLMENGYNPSFDNPYILFDFEDNTGILHYDEGMLNIRIIFSIEGESPEMFTKASNTAMNETSGVKMILPENQDTLIFSSETMCDNLREFKKFFPRAIANLSAAIRKHKAEMKELLQESMLYQDLYTYEDENHSTKKFCS